MYTQIVGKIRASLAYPEPEWAHVTLYVTPRGLTTSPIPYRERVFQIDFDLNAHVLQILVSDGSAATVALGGSVADFYDKVLEALRSLAIDVHIRPIPDEVPNPIAFTEDTVHKTYDGEQANRFWQILVQVDDVMKEHRAPFRRRHTPVQFFWGTFDLAYARFSGRPATPPRNDVITRKAMDAEEICVGFWPGDDRFPEPAFWCYAFPQPAGIEKAIIGPKGAAWHPELGLFILPYEIVRASESPRDAIRQFLTSTYNECASLAKWDAV